MISPAVFIAVRIGAYFYNNVIVIPQNHNNFVNGECDNA